MRFGFRRSDPHVLANALLDHVVTGQVTGVENDHRGWLHEVTGPLASPDGRDPDYLTV